MVFYFYAKQEFEGKCLIRLLLNLVTGTRPASKTPVFTSKKLPKLVFLFIKVFEGLINKFATHFFMTQENFEIKLPLFEGPFDLLLFFIERDELDIYDIPIAKITHDFLEYIHHMETLNVEV